MAIRIKLHLSELIQGMQERAAQASPGSRLAERGLNLDGQVDFTNAQRGEVTVVAPFRQVLRIQERVRTVPKPKPIPEHPIVRAQKWHQMLQSGQVATRSALARKLKLRPDAVTRILKLIELDPGIQAYLASLKSADAIWHFGYMPMGKLAELPFEKQRAAFERIRGEYELVEQRNLARQRTLSLPSTLHARAATRPQLSVG